MKANNYIAWNLQAAWCIWLSRPAHWTHPTTTMTSPDQVTRHTPRPPYITSPDQVTRHTPRDHPENSPPARHTHTTTTPTSRDQVTLFDRVRAGWYSVHVTSHPDKIYDALNASISVLRDVAISPINRRELERARTTTLTRHDSDMKDNTYWVGLLTHLQNDGVPHKSLQCLRDLKTIYEAITVEDIYHLYNFFNFDDDHIFTCIGISGKTAPVVPDNYLMGGDYSLEEDVVPAGWGGSMPRMAAAPGEQPQMNPVSVITALMAAAQSMKIKQAMNNGNASSSDVQPDRK